MPLDWARYRTTNLGTALSQSRGARGQRARYSEEAVAAFREALKEWTRERVPLDWAMTQNNLGDALERLGECESSSEPLEEAVAGFDAALEVLVAAKCRPLSSGSLGRNRARVASLLEQRRKEPA